MRLRTGMLLVVVGLTVLVIQGKPGGVFAHHSRMPRFVGSRIDSEVTSEYLAAIHAYLLAIERNMRSVDRAISKEVRTVGSGCPNVAADAPMNLSRSHVDVDVIEILAIMAAHVDVAIVSRLRTRVSPLHWSDSRVTEVIQRSTQAASTETSLKELHLCDSLTLWAHSRFLRIPPGLSRFSHRAEALSEAVDLLPSVLTRYENQDQRKTVREVGSLLVAVGRELRIRVSDGRKEIEKVIGLRRGNAADRGQSRPIQTTSGAA